MLDVNNPDGLVHIMLLALPVAVLVTLLMLLARKKSKKPRKSLTANDGGEGDAPVQKPDAGPIPYPPRNDEAMQIALPSSDVRLKPCLLPSAEAGLVLIQERLYAAQAGNDRTALAPLYLELARAHRAAGQDSDFQKALRSAAGLASQHGPRAAHADARLELAEAAFIAGDLTSACEHWQLAKTALLDDGQREAHARVEKRMRDQGCPTDWVLTDF